MDILFPQGFIWGTATSAHQTEGGNTHSDWWAFEHAGNIRDGTTSGMACDTWNRFDEDFRLMQQLGYPNYRMSVEWAKIEPVDGHWDMAAAAHYRRMFDSLRRHGIRLCLNFYHFTLPDWVARAGGWLNEATVSRFERYCRFVVEQFGDYPDIWMTMNEPMVVVIAGYLGGEFPPMRRRVSSARRVFVNLLRAHAAAYQAIHDLADERRTGRKPLASITANLTYVKPGTRGPLARAQAWLVHRANNTSFLDAITTGRVPFPWGHGQRIPGLKGSCDYVGVNYYNRTTVKADLRNPRNFFMAEGPAPEAEISEMGWEVYPEGLYHVVMDAWRRMRLPVYVMENGTADAGDVCRPSYLVRHLVQLHRAILNGADVRSYYHWSFIDNFEWREGFTKKFGLVSIDRDDGSLARRPRPSACLFSEIIRRNGLTDEMIERYGGNSGLGCFRSKG